MARIFTFFAYTILTAALAMLCYEIGRDQVYMGSCPAGAHWTPPGSHQPKETIA